MLLQRSIFVATNYFNIIFSGKSNLCGRYVVDIVNTAKIELSTSFSVCVIIIFYSYDLS